MPKRDPDSPGRLDALRERAERLKPRFMRKSDEPRAKREPNIVHRKVLEWGSRVLGAATSGGLSRAEEAYEGHQTRQDYLWNTVGLAAWGMVFPLLTIVCTQLVGAEDAGRFSLAFVAGTLLMIVANFGMRTYQVSDLRQAHSFMDYQVHRWITCLVMLVAGWVFCAFRGYDSAMFSMTMWVFVYKMVDGLADCYEGRLQQMDKLYLAGISQAIRSVAALAVFSLLLLLTRDLGIASIGMGVAALLTCILFTIPLALLETPRSARLSFPSVGRLFAQCFPLFIALFLYTLIDNMPKFMMEGMLSYDNQLYFNALYFPAQAILMATGFMYKPLLVRMADTWNDIRRRKRFDMFVGAAVGVVAALTIVGVLLMRWIGIPVMSVLYGLDFEQFRHTSYLMILAGGITAGIDFLYQVMTVMRRQRVVPRLYLITFGFSLFVPFVLIQMNGLRGAVLSYVVIMAILFVLLLMEYIGVRMDYLRNPEADPAYRETLARLGLSASQVSPEELMERMDAPRQEPTLRRPRVQAGERRAPRANAPQQRAAAEQDAASGDERTPHARTAQDDEGGEGRARRTNAPHPRARSGQAEVGGEGYAPHDQAPHANAPRTNAPRTNPPRTSAPHPRTRASQNGEGGEGRTRPQSPTKRKR